ncbi:MAG: hypothetical protein IID36_12025 [Planctomycetes bacterium]|nr:hypothetical protein [Planctomycetota bacterium]
MMRKNNKWVALFTLLAGSTMFASTCASKAQDAFFDAGAEFVGRFTTVALDGLIPLDD